MYLRRFSFNGLNQTVPPSHIKRKYAHEEHMLWNQAFRDNDWFLYVLNEIGYDSAMC